MGRKVNPKFRKKGVNFLAYVHTVFYEFRYQTSRRVIMEAFTMS